ncbi:MAG TPA: enoyl-CoA hydratase/isomerase family protein [Thermoleophilaceae bacterium]|nr:enoyl-CoA hydratase/isomerase family protein [Thermoleophilaceae bacterium]
MSKVLYEVDGRIAYVTINRPEARNAVSFEVHNGLIEAWERFAEDGDADVAILTGRGDAFCAGADLKEYLPKLALSTASQLRPTADRGLGGLTRGLHRIYKPIIAAVNGWALAGGFELALACDIRVASERAMFGSFEARRGFHHADGGIVRLTNIVGAGFALEMVLTAEPIDAERAYQRGLVSRVVPHDELIPAAEEVAGHILRNSQTALRSAKRTVLDVIGKPLDDQLFIEAWHGFSGGDMNETAERITNFFAKTDPGRAGPGGNGDDRGTLQET